MIQKSYLEYLQKYYPQYLEHYYNRKISLNYVVNEFSTSTENDYKEYILQKDKICKNFLKNLKKYLTNNKMYDIMNKLLRNSENELNIEN